MSFKILSTQIIPRFCDPTLIFWKILKSRGPAQMWLTNPFWAVGCSAALGWTPLPPHALHPKTPRSAWQGCAHARGCVTSPLQHLWFYSLLAPLPQPAENAQICHFFIFPYLLLQAHCFHSQPANVAQLTPVPWSCS